MRRSNWRSTTAITCGQMRTECRTPEIEGRLLLAHFYTDSNCTGCYFPQCKSLVDRQLRRVRSAVSRHVTTVGPGSKNAQVENLHRVFLCHITGCLYRRMRSRSSHYPRCGIHNSRSRSYECCHQHEYRSHLQYGDEPSYAHHIDLYGSGAGRGCSGNRCLQRHHCDLYAVCRFWPTTVSIRPQSPRGRRTRVAYRWLPTIRGVLQPLLWRRR